jgi:hypothetical protein
MAGDPQEVFGAVTLDAPANGNEDGTRCQRRTALGLTPSGKNLAKSAPKRVDINFYIFTLSQNQ